MKVQDLPPPIQVTIGGIRAGERPYIELRFELKSNEPLLEALLRSVFGKQVSEAMEAAQIAARTPARDPETGMRCTIVYGADFTESSARMRADKAKRLVEMALQDPRDEDDDK